MTSVSTFVGGQKSSEFPNTSSNLEQFKRTFDDNRNVDNSPYGCQCLKHEAPNPHIEWQKYTAIDAANIFICVNSSTSIVSTQS